MTVQPKILNRGLAVAFCGVLALFLAAPQANALPSFARQTGQQCAACHNGFPELTPYGRLFKLNGYVFGGGQSNLPPLAAMIVEDYTHTQAGQSGGAKAHYGPNNNFSLNAASLFYGGRILGDYGLGAFAQVTYNDPSRNFHWDNTDVRWAHAMTIYGDETVFGVSLNNNPGISDVWNTTPAWRYPFQSSSLTSPPGATLMISTYGQQVLGASAYVFWNRLVYAEAGAYHTLPPDVISALGMTENGSDSFSGLAPYWRLAFQPQWGPNSLEVGTFGMEANIYPGRVHGFGTDDKTDLGFDVQYQYLTDAHSVSAQASWISEHQHLNSTFTRNNSSNLNDQLHSFNLKTTYSYEQTYYATLAYSRIQGSGDPGVYSSSSRLSSPNSDWWTIEGDYMPFNHGGPSFWPWLNMKLGLQYIWYTKFNGATNNYDNNGHNAADNNTLYAFAWFAF
ncbi:MAG: hypothetical protein KGJ66_02990 [Alphaproteobacteria bacterium]|nr:hypothetical protein [Alphaproteobacteria bacterium]